jgi:hypothetical protein
VQLAGLPPRPAPNVTGSDVRLVASTSSESHDSFAQELRKNSTTDSGIVLSPGRCTESLMTPRMLPSRRVVGSRTLTELPEPQRGTRRRHHPLDENRGPKSGATPTATGVNNPAVTSRRLPPDGSRWVARVPLVRNGPRSTTKGWKS